MINYLPDDTKNALHQKLLRAAFTRFINKPSIHTLELIALATQRGGYVNGHTFDAPCLVGQHSIEKEIGRSCEECPLFKPVFFTTADDMDICGLLTYRMSKYRQEVYEVAWKKMQGDILLAVIQFAVGFEGGITK